MVSPPLTLAIAKFTSTSVPLLLAHQERYCGDVGQGCQAGQEGESIGLEFVKTMDDPDSDLVKMLSQ